MQVGQRETAGIAKQIAESIFAATVALQAASDALARPGASLPSTEEAVKLVGSAFVDIAMLRAYQVYQGELILAQLDGGSLQDVKLKLYEHLVDNAKGTSESTAIDEHGTEFVVGALSKHYQDQVIDTFAHAIVSIEALIKGKEDAETEALAKDFFGGGLHVPPGSLLFTAQGGGSPRAG